MSLLLDTHAIMWLASDDPRLSPTVRERVGAGVERVYVSVVSGWEYGLKRRKRPDQLQRPFDRLIVGSGFQRLDFTFALHRYSERLPPIHRDPFDRMLIAQALEHGLTLVTVDQAIRRYPVPTLW